MLPWRPPFLPAAGAEKCCGFLKKILPSLQSVRAHFPKKGRIVPSFRASCTKKKAFRPSLDTVFLLSRQVVQFLPQLRNLDILCGDLLIQLDIAFLLLFIEGLIASSAGLFSGRIPDSFPTPLSEQLPRFPDRSCRSACACCASASFEGPIPLSPARKHMSPLFFCLFYERLTSLYRLSNMVLLLGHTCKKASKNGLADQKKVGLQGFLTSVVIGQ